MQPAKMAGKLQFAPHRNIGEIGMWIGDGYKKIDVNKDSTRATAMFKVDSVGNLFKTLKEGGENIIQDAPVEMMPGTFWLQFTDPAGNIIEVLSGE